MNSGKRAIFAGLAAGILFAVALFSAGGHWAIAHGAVAQDENYRFYVTAAPPATLLEQHPGETLKAPAGAPRPLSAVVVTSCGLAVALFIQLDATHLLRADPRQSDIFTAVNGEQRQDTAGPMKWDDAYKLAQSAVLSSHVVLPCTDGPQT
jgi:hypothetical protein